MAVAALNAKAQRRLRCLPIAARFTNIVTQDGSSFAQLIGGKPISTRRVERQARLKDRAPCGVAYLSSETAPEVITYQLLPT
jgi:hypothetical protein